MENNIIIKEIKKNIVVKDILEDLEKVNMTDINTKEFDRLRNNIINVGEYNN